MPGLSSTDMLQRSRRGSQASAGDATPVKDSGQQSHVPVGCVISTAGMSGLAVTGPGRDPCRAAGRRDPSGSCRARSAGSAVPVRSSSCLGEQTCYLACAQSQRNMAERPKSCRAWASISVYARQPASTVGQQSCLTQDDIMRDISNPHAAACKRWPICGAHRGLTTSIHVWPRRRRRVYMISTLTETCDASQCKHGLYVVHGTIPPERPGSHVAVFLPQAIRCAVGTFGRIRVWTAVSCEACTHRCA